MPSWKSTCKWVGVIFLLFFGIPIRVKGPDEDNRKLFDSYIKRFNKSYEDNSEEYDKRFEAFKNTLSIIDGYNSDDTHMESARYGLTQFSDMTETEFMEKHLDVAKRVTKKHQISRRKHVQPHNDTVLMLSGIGEEGIHRFRRALIGKGIPLKVDWRDKGIISPVRNQGLCGACWAYSTVHTAEAMAAQVDGHLTPLSVQQMIDCARNGNFGCNGGDICSLLQWIAKDNVTIQTEKEYPINTGSSQCPLKVPAYRDGVRIKDYSCGSVVGSETVLLEWLAKGGPAAVAINALSWQNYLGGVVQFHCPGQPLSLNHAVQLIGYDLTAEIPYYIAKNSWGTQFGLSGYLHLAIGDNVCGLANEVSMIHVENVLSPS